MIINWEARRTLRGMASEDRKWRLFHSLNAMCKLDCGRADNPTLYVTNSDLIRFVPPKGKMTILDPKGGNILLITVCVTSRTATNYRIYYALLAKIKSPQ